eukprot:2565234-Amphidinium_carterae.1
MCVQYQALKTTYAAIQKTIKNVTVITPRVGYGTSALVPYTSVEPPKCEMTSAIKREPSIRWLRSKNPVRNEFMSAIPRLPLKDGTLSFVQGR